VVSSGVVDVGVAGDQVWKIKLRKGSFGGHQAGEGAKRACVDVTYSELGEGGAKASLWCEAIEGHKVLWIWEKTRGN